jgi:hypothetical protein
VAERRDRAPAEQQRSIMSIRVRVNLKNYKTHHLYHGRLGTAPRIPKDGHFWNVLWDGTKKVQQFHKDFIEVVETHDQEKE